MTDQTRLNARIRVIYIAGLACLLVSGIALLIVPAVRLELIGLLIGELGGAYVVYSLIRQGHRNDEVTGAALFGSGMLGMITRIVVLAVAIIVAMKTHTSAVLALGGYMLGYVLTFIGMAGYFRSNTTTSEEGR